MASSIYDFGIELLLQGFDIFAGSIAISDYVDIKGNDIKVDKVRSYTKKRDKKLAP